MTVAEKLLPVNTSRAPTSREVNDIIALINGLNFGAPFKSTVYASAVQPNFDVINQSSNANAPGLRVRDDALANIITGTKAGVSIGKPTAITGNTTVTGTMGVSGNTTVGGTLGVTGATTLASTLGVTGATLLSSTLGVTGATTLTGALVANGAVTLGDAVGDAISVLGTPTFAEDATFTKAIIANGAVTLGNAVADAITVNGAMTVAEDLTLSKGLIVDTTTFVVNETDNKVGVGVAPASTGSMFEVAGRVFVTSDAGGATAGAGLDLSYTAGTNTASIVAIDKGSAAFKNLDVFVLAGTLRTSATRRIVWDATGVAFNGITTGVARPTLPANATDLATAITLVNALKTMSINVGLAV